jgi:hypothetical protein
MDIENVAQLMGMRQSEIVEVVPGADGVLVRTHDGVWTLIDGDGQLVHSVAGPQRDSGQPDPEVDEATAAMLRGFSGEPEPDAAPAKPAPKRRSRS